MKKNLPITSWVAITLLIVTFIISCKTEPENVTSNRKNSDKSTSNQTPADSISATQQYTESVLSFFTDTVTSIVKTRTKDYDKLGLGGGVDGFVLRETFPGLVPSDFINVIAIGGEYSVAKGELTYTGNMASNSAVLTKEGMRTLFQNCIKRLPLNATTKDDVLKIIIALNRK